MSQSNRFPPGYVSLTVHELGISVSSPDRRSEGGRGFRSSGSDSNGGGYSSRSEGSRNSKPASSRGAFRGKSDSRDNKVGNSRRNMGSRGRQQQDGGGRGRSRGSDVAFKTGTPEAV